ncbi:hypothetical protein [Mucilaginibacter auburnensis]|nr:hypothetical protein [Mucilaginibacter auburnensis]
MKKIALITVHFLTAAALVAVACTDHPVNRLKGNWIAEDGIHELKITDKTFAIDAEAQINEDYFVKDDTIFTSFEGNQPYSKYTITKIDDQSLTLLDPDSVTINFRRK